MANKKISELTTISGILQDDDYLIVYNTSDTSSEKTKKLPVADFISVVNTSITLYVDPAGSDTTGDGSSGNPFATPNKAWEWVNRKFFTYGGSVTIQIADGTYNGLSTIHGSSVSRVSFIGNATSPENVVLNFSSGQHGFYGGRNTYVYIKGLKIVGGGSRTQYGVATDTGAGAQVWNCIIDNWLYGLSVHNMGHLFAGTTVSNNCTAAAMANSLGSMMTTNGTLSGSATGAYADRMGRIYLFNNTFSSNSQNTTTFHSGQVLSE